MGLHTSSKGFKLNLQSNARHLKNMLELLSALFEVSTPNHCLWQGDLGEELNLLATVLEQSIVSFTNDNPESNAGRPFLDSHIGPLYLLSVYDPYPIVPTELSVGVLYIPILHTVNHFQALVPPRN